MTQIALSPEVLNWAAEKAGDSLRSFAEKTAKRAQVRERILEGKLTIPQIEKLAKRAHIPFGFLFLLEPPEERRPELPDLRRVQDAHPLSDDFYETLEDVIAKQQWYGEYLSEIGSKPLPFVGRFKNADRRSANAISQDIRNELGLTDEDRSKSADASAYFSRISEKAERQGILVFKNGIVKSNTRRLLSEKEFRGFAIADQNVPVVFINGKDAEVAAVFTLVHELAHIWLGVDGVSDLSTRSDNGIERLCNQIASNILVPNDRFLEIWKGFEGISGLARYFRVSSLVIARRALDNGLINQERYDEISNRPIRVKKSTGASPYQTIPVRNSKRVTRTVVASAMSGGTLLRDAASLLNVQPKTIIELGKRLSKHG